jgi:hypothetical protein
MCVRVVVVVAVVCVRACVRTSVGRCAFVSLSLCVCTWRGKHNHSYLIGLQICRSHEGNVRVNRMLEQLHKPLLARRLELGDELRGTLEALPLVGNELYIGDCRLQRHCDASREPLTRGCRRRVPSAVSVAVTAVRRSGL